MTSSPPEPDLLPIDLVQINGHWLVHLVNPERLDLTRGFLKQAVPDERPLDKFVALPDWLEANAAAHLDESFSRTSGIFHVARCGSTLLTQNLKATGNFICLSEPKFIGRALTRYPDDPGDLPPPQVLKTMVAVWQAWAQTHNQRLLIKFSSIGAQAVTRVLDHLADARFVFLYREPVGVLESLSRKPPAYVRNKKERQHKEPVAGLDEWGDKSIPYYAARSYCAIVQRFIGLEDPRLLAIDYADLEQEFHRIVGHFDSTYPRANLEWSGNIYAKWKGDKPTPYEPTDPAIVDAFAEREAALIEVAKGFYDRLRQSFIAARVPS